MFNIVDFDEPNKDKEKAKSTSTESQAQKKKVKTKSEETKEKSKGFQLSSFSTTPSKAKPQPSSNASEDPVKNFDIMSFGTQTTERRSSSRRQSVVKKGKTGSLSKNPPAEQNAKTGPLRRRRNTGPLKASDESSKPKKSLKPPEKAVPSIPEPTSEDRKQAQKLFDQAWTCIQQFQQLETPDIQFLKTAGKLLHKSLSLVNDQVDAFILISYVFYVLGKNPQAFKYISIAHALEPHSLKVLKFKREILKITEDQEKFLERHSMDNKKQIQSIRKSTTGPLNKRSTTGPLSPVKKLKRLGKE